MIDFEYAQARKLYELHLKNSLRQVGGFDDTIIKLLAINKSVPYLIYNNDFVKPTTFQVPDRLRIFIKEVCAINSGDIYLRSGEMSLDWMRLQIDRRSPSTKQPKRIAEPRYSIVFQFNPSGHAIKIKPAGENPIEHIFGAPVLWDIAQLPLRFELSRFSGAMGNIGRLPS